MQTPIDTPLARLSTAPGLADRVYESLVAAIGSGALVPGARLLQEDIAARLAVSRQPVLQALRQLKSDGLVLDAPGRGVVVAPLDADSVQHVYQVRGALDALAARLAAERGAVLDPALLHAGRKAARGGSVAAMIEADAAFHQALYAASGNPLLGQSARLHWHHLRRAMGAVLQSSALRETVWDEHAAITDAVGTGDAALAETLAGGHAARAGSHITRQLTLALLRPPGRHTKEHTDATHP